MSVHGVTERHPGDYERELARQRQEILTRAGDLLLEARAVRTRLDALADVILPGLADCCVIHLLDGGDDAVRVTARHVDPDCETLLCGVLESVPAMPGQPYGPGAVMVSRQPQLIADVDDDVLLAIAGGDRELLARYRALALCSAYCLPLMGHDRVLGSLFLGRITPREWVDADQRLAQQVAARAAAAVDNALLRAGEQSARQLLIDLHRITAALADATSVDEVAQAVVELAREAIDADAVLMARVFQGHFDVLASVGTDPEALQIWQWMSVDAETPPAHALRSGEPIFFTSRGELVAQLPGIVGLGPHEAYAVLPLAREGRRLGVIRFGWRRPRIFAPGNQEFLLSVAQQVASGLDRAALIAAEQTARTAAEEGQRRVALLAEVTHTLSASLDVDAVLSQLAQWIVPRLADQCTVDLVDTPGEPPRLLAVAAVSPRLVELLHATDAFLPRRRNPKTMVGRALATGMSVLATEVTEEHLRRISINDEQAQLYLDMNLVSGIVVPLVARGQVLGAVSMFTTTGSGRQYGESDLELFSELGRRAGLSVDNARMFTREHEAATTLQHSLLPEIPELPGLDAAARYLPAAAEAGVGGDLFDLFALPDGAIAIAIGDVMGHDMKAAAAMGQLRSVLRSYAWGGAAPSDVLDRMDMLVQNFEMAQLATALYARLETVGYAADRVLRYANAGHLPPVLQLPDGSAHFLEGGQSVLIGAPGRHDRSEGIEPMPVGSTLLLYTDGLIEQRHRPWSPASPSCSPPSGRTIQRPVPRRSAPTWWRRSPVRSSSTT